MTPQTFMAFWVITRDVKLYINARLEDPEVAPECDLLYFIHLFFFTLFFFSLGCVACFCACMYAVRINHAVISGGPATWPWQARLAPWREGAERRAEGTVCVGRRALGGPRVSSSGFFTENHRGLQTPASQRRSLNTNERSV